MRLLKGRHLDLPFFHPFVNFYVPFKEEGGYCFANVGRSVDQMVSADYLKYHLSQSLHISHVG